MGSKRPEQSHKDKLSTDYKTRTDDQRIHAQDKQRLDEERGKLAERNEQYKHENQAPDERDVLESD
jgi:hypothetical protein